MKSNAPIGVLDSGVGGLSVLKVLHQMMPHENFIYVGDTARTPYGSRSEEEIRQFVEEIISWLESQGVKQVVIACNTLTMLGIDSLKKEHPFELVGMSKGEQLLLAASKKKKIGVFATQFTISTEAHKKAILAADASAEVYPMACPKFVPLIEGEQFGNPEIEQAVAEYAAPLKEAGIDALILSCTHYPFIKDVVEAEFGSEVTVIDPAEATAKLSKEALEKEGLLGDCEGSVTICCTADLERVKRLASRMLPLEQCQFKEITLIP
ncbi:MAG: glutamate racemase [Phascolarctobacterium sp.]|jgi:glutamate racemase|nr:glutamate racemase [Phascolarctobacterium sp.]